MNKNLDILTYAVSLVKPGLGLMSVMSEVIHIFVSCKMSEFLEKSPLSGAGKHPDFQG